MKIQTLLIPVLTLLAVMSFKQRSYAQITPLPYYENFDTQAIARWTPYRLGTNDQDDFPWYITIHNPYSEPFSMMHTCTVPTAQANNWTVSKNAFSFAAGGKIDSIRSWITATNPPASGDTIGIYLLTGNQDPALANTVTLLHDFRGANFQTNTWVKTTDILIPPTQGQSYIAFRYKTANNCISIFLDNMQLSGNGSSSIKPVNKMGIEFKISPNPVADQLSIQSEVAVETINIYDLTGRKIHTQEYQPVINMSFLTSGTYLLELVDKDKKRGMQKVMKQ